MAFKGRLINWIFYGCSKSLRVYVANNFCRSKCNLSFCACCIWHQHRSNIKHRSVLFWNFNLNIFLFWYHKNMIWEFWYLMCIISFGSQHILFPVTSQLTDISSVFFHFSYLNKAAAFITACCCSFFWKEQGNGALN